METKKARIEYLLSEEGRKKSLLAGGDGKERQVIETDITPEIIRLAQVAPQGEVILHIGFKPGRNGYQEQILLEVKLLSEYFMSPWSNFNGRQYFDEPQSVEALLIWEQQRIKNTVGVRNDPSNIAKIEQMEADAAAASMERKAKRDAEEAEWEAVRKAREDAEKTEKARSAKEKSDWIAAHGSDHLKRATALDYNCQRRYVEERAEAEFPAFALDFDNLASWRGRACPSEDALEYIEVLIAQGHDTECVWLTAPPYKVERDPEYYGPEDEFDPCEAIVIRNYLGKYDLVKML